MTGYSFNTDLLEENNKQRIFLNTQLIKINIIIEHLKNKYITHDNTLHYNILSKAIKRQLLECDEIERKIMNNLKWEELDE
jgi:hypothetical protein